MELTTLRNFLEVAKAGNITRAAEHLHITQPSLSRQIMLLEKELGQKLFFRKHYRVELTNAGKALLERAAEIIRISDLAVSELSSIEKHVKGDLFIAFADGTFTGTVPVVIDSFRNAYPEVKLNFFSGGLDYLQILIDKKIPDVICYFRGSIPKGFNTVMTDQIVPAGLVMTNNDPLTRYKELTLDIYSSVPVIYPRGIVLDENEEDINIPVSEDQVVARVEEPMVFMDLIRRSGAYIFCLEPSPEVLRRHDLSFRPIAPGRRSAICFVQRPVGETNTVVEVFMDYIRSFYIPRTH